ncbi:MAG: hypothetical protein DMF68_20310 [Acidobacteria bacterium]|nr:MAG: hypothetical protein DMF68_20310 [Acidobacteriota bacterium]
MIWRPRSPANRSRKHFEEAGVWKLAYTQKTSARASHFKKHFGFEITDVRLTIHSLGGCAIAFMLMFILHIFGAMGAGDVKLFAAVGSLMGTNLVLPTFLVVILTGGAFALLLTLRLGAVRTTMQRVLQILVGLLPGWEMPRFAVPQDRRHTIPYGVAITFGSLISLAIFRA